MRHVRTTTLILALAACAASAAASGADPGWEKLKSLVGEWQGTYEGKAATRVTYRLVSNGTALMETLDAEDSSQMITIYHPDGARLGMTHYCSQGNQPRMRSQGLRDGRLEFSFVDASNLGDAGGLVMTGLVLTFRDADHFAQDWTSRQGAREQVGHFELSRSK